MYKSVYLPDPLFWGVSSVAVAANVEYIFNLNSKGYAPTYSALREGIHYFGCRELMMEPHWRGIRFVFDLASQFFLSFWFILKKYTIIKSLLIGKSTPNNLSNIALTQCPETLRFNCEGTNRQVLDRRSPGCRHSSRHATWRSRSEPAHSCLSLSCRLARTNPSCRTWGSYGQLPTRTAQALVRLYEEIV